MNSRSKKNRKNQKDLRNLSNQKILIKKKKKRKKENKFDLDLAKRKRLKNNIDKKNILQLMENDYKHIIKYLTNEK